MWADSLNDYTFPKSYYTNVSPDGDVIDGYIDSTIPFPDIMAFYYVQKVREQYVIFMLSAKHFIILFLRHLTRKIQYLSCSMFISDFDCGRSFTNSNHKLLQWILWSRPFLPCSW